MIRDLAGRPVVAMEHGGARGVPDVVTQQVQPPTEVNVLEEREVVPVESANFLEHVSADEHRAAAREEDPARPVVDRLPAPMIDLKTVPLEVDAAADEVDGRPVPIQDP